VAAKARKNSPGTPQCIPGNLWFPRSRASALSKRTLANPPEGSHFVILHFGTAYCLRGHYTTFYNFV